MTKSELKSRLEAGECLNDLLPFEPGQDCEIYKAEGFAAGDEVIYVPDIFLNGIHINKPITDPEELEEVLFSCYTGDDFIVECDGNLKKAEALFWFCDWQSPSSALNDSVIEDEEDFDDE